MALVDIQKSSTQDQGELVQDRGGNLIPKRKIINDATHVYNPDKDIYEPESNADSIKSGIVGAGTKLWNSLKGS